MYSFLSRVQYYEDSILSAVNDENNLEDLFHTFYGNFERCMHRGKKDANTYNLHAFSMHSLEQRKGECWKFSAEAFESAYFVIKQLFSKGTTNRTKQIVTKYLVRDKVRHRCNLNKKLIVKVKKTVSQDNSVVTMTENGQLQFLRVRKIEGGTIDVTPIVVSPFQAAKDVNMNLPWNLIGVYKYEGESEARKQVSLSNLKGKGVIVAGTICELRHEWLQSRIQQ